MDCWLTYHGFTIRGRGWKERSRSPSRSRIARSLFQPIRRVITSYISIEIDIYGNRYIWKIVGPLLAVQAIMPVLALPSAPIIIERGTFERICNGSKRPLVGLICDWSRRPRGHVPPPYSNNGQDSGIITKCENYKSLLNNYIDLDGF